MSNTNNPEKPSTPGSSQPLIPQKAKGFTGPANQTPPATPSEGTVAKFDGGHENIVTFNHQPKNSG
ncbi:MULTISPECIES: hypothetical protein [unclassified Microcoleus]|uniref:hypothetical protein n=1 Tax=unclassified Microcoleus TaxID=2642155 RepID=UPI002FD10414